MAHDTSPAAIPAGGGGVLAPGTGVPTGRLGIWLFLASEIMFFGAFIGGYLVLRMGASSWPNPTEILNIPVLGFNTFVLICSSLSMVYALQSIQKGDVAKLRRYLGITALLGALFLVIKITDYTHMVHEGITPSSSLFGSCYYLLTGFHGLHVTGGVVSLFVMWVLAGRGAFSADNPERIEYVGLYWHFVDIVWIVLFTILCLV